MAWTTRLIAAGLATFFAVWYRIHEMMLQWVIAIIGELLEDLPPELQIDFGPWLYWFGLANHWFPVEEGLVITLIFFNYLVNLILLRLVLKAIPTVW